MKTVMVLSENAGTINYKPVVKNNKGKKTITTKQVVVRCGVGKVAKKTKADNIGCVLSKEQKAANKVSKKARPTLIPKPPPPPPVRPKTPVQRKPKEVKKEAPKKPMTERQKLMALYKMNPLLLLTKAELKKIGK